MFCLNNVALNLETESTVSVNLRQFLNIGTVRFLVEISKWAKKRFQGIFKSAENASRDQAMPSFV